MKLLVNTENQRNPINTSSKFKVVPGKPETEQERVETGSPKRQEMARWGKRGQFSTPHHSLLPSDRPKLAVQGTN